MTYEIGQKVETPLGVGNVVGYHEFYEIYSVDLLTNPEFTDQPFKEYHLKPYKTANDKLIEMGLHLKITKNWAGGIFSHEWWNDNNRVIAFYVNEKETTVFEANHDIMRIIPQYLEEMAE